jgi:hypothetical protein
MNEEEYQTLMERLSEQCRTPEFRDRIRRAEKMAMDLSRGQDPDMIPSFCSSCGMRIEDCQCEEFPL